MEAGDGKGGSGDEGTYIVLRVVTSRMLRSPQHQERV